MQTTSSIGLANLGEGALDPKDCMILVGNFVSTVIAHAKEKS